MNRKMTGIIRLYKKHKQIIVYIFFGLVTTLVNYAIFMLCRRFLSMNVLFSNVAAWILSVLTAFFTNKKYVFSSAEKGGGFFKEITAFFAARAVSGLIDTGAVVLCADILLFNETAVKLISNVFVIAFNYLAGKFFIFKKSKAEKTEITLYSQPQKSDFASLLDTYFEKEIKMLVSASELDEIVCQIESDINDGFMWLLMLYVNAEPSGFSLFQIDNEKSSWNERPGWGFIREFYVSPKFRRQGLGTRLCDATVSMLKSKGAESAYLTAGVKAKRFWKSTDFKFGGIRSPKNGYDIFEIDKL